MPLSGLIDVGFPMPYPVPTGMLALIAENGSHHVMAKSGLSANFCELCWAENNQAAATIITNTTFRADIAASPMALVDGGSGSEIIVAKTKYAVPGTPYVIILGESYNAGLAKYNVYGIRYAVVSPGVTRIDGYYHYVDDFGLHDDFLTGTWGGALGIMKSGDYAYFVDAFGHFFANFRVKLGRLPLVGNDIDLSANSWHARLWAMPAGNMTAMNGWWDRGGGDAGNWATVVQLASGIGVFNYAFFNGAQPSEFVGTIVSGIATNTGETDFASVFVIPFSDEGFDFSGDPSTNNYDFYTNPCVNVLPDGRLEFIFMRRFSDNENWIGVQRFICSSDLTDVQGFGLQTFFFSTDLYLQHEAWHVTREGDQLIYMARENQQLIFAEFTVPVGEPVEAEYPPITTEVDTVEELPPADAVIVTQRWLLRTAHLRQWGEIAVNDLRLTIKRGVGDTEEQQYIWVRVNRDNKGFGKWAKKSLGEKGDRVMTIYFGGFGTARDWQFEFATTDVCEIELRKVEIMPTELGH